jgi:PAS domain S-box-containing protein
VNPGAGGPPPEDLPAAWARALAQASSVPMTAGQALAFTSTLSDWAADAHGGREAARKAGMAIGTALIDTHHTHPESLAASITVLAEHLLPDLDQSSFTALCAGLATGYAEALRERTRGEQEAIRNAVLTAHRTSEARFRAVFRSAPLGIGITDAEGRLLEVNEPLARMMGRDARSVRGLEVRDLRLPTDSPEYWEQYEALLSGRRRQMSGEKYFTLPNGELVWVKMRASSVVGEDGKVALLIGVFEDVTERRQFNERLRHQANHDPLTGLPNRAQLQDRLAALLEGKDGAPPAPIGLCFLDIDGFKGVNDTLGHDAGDRLLIEMADRLREVAAPYGHLVARMGGDEFAILLGGAAATTEAGSDGGAGSGKGVEPTNPVTSDGGERPCSDTGLAERILEAVRRPLWLEGRELSVTASMGIARCPVAGSAPTELLRAADITLYWAKSGGRDRWAEFDPERDAREVERHALSQALPTALDRGELFVEYQPIVELGGGGYGHERAVRSFEALVRWKHPERGLLGPSQFVPLAEESGTIVALGRWVLRRATAEAALWPAGPDGEAVSVSVNVAVPQVRDPGFVHEVREALENSGLAPERLILEITESAVMDPGEGGLPAVDRLRALADLGVRIAIDDFGTGYSNLNYLRRLPAHALKIDSSFVKGLLPASGAGPGAPSEEPIVTSMITLAHAYGMSLTAEGVETEAQARKLLELGADTGQGYYFSRPVPAERVLTLIAGGSPEHRA